VWDELARWATGGGGAGVVVGVCWLIYRFHFDAINAERGRADDARARAVAEAKRAEAAERRADVREEQLGIVLGRARDPAKP
jgi:hypothetical protein